MRPIALAAGAAGLVGALSLPACAGPSSESPGFVGDRVVGPRNESVRWESDERESRDTLSAPLESVAEALPGVFEFMGLPVERRSSRLFETPSYRIRDRLYEEQPNSAWFDCGEGLTGARADTHEIHFTVRTELRPTASGGTVVETLVAGRASDRSSNTDPVPCWGTGRLEREVTTLLRRQVGGGADRL